MNREIKFRIWADNKFYNKCLVGNTNNTNDEKWTCPMVWLEKQKEWVHCDNGIICQYTGLHDKDGQEIYEGDIVEFEDVGEEVYEYKEGFNFNNIAQVIYKNGIYTLANFGESDNSYYAADAKDEEILEEVLRNGNCKKIGNIYDNPELLGGE